MSGAYRREKPRVGGEYECWCDSGWGQLSLLLLCQLADTPPLLPGMCVRYPLTLKLTDTSLYELYYMPSRVKSDRRIRICLIIIAVNYKCVALCCNTASLQVYKAAVSPPVIIY